MMRNVDNKVAEGFGHEWSNYTQSEDELPTSDRAAVFDDYFSIFPWDELPENPTGIDVGCGSGRWAALVLPRVGHLHALDASADALDVAKRNLSPFKNVTFYHASAGEIPLEDNTLDFAYSLGVLHHVPDTQGAILEVASKIRPGAPFLIYLYYALENRPRWFRLVWQASNAIRLVASRMGPKTKIIFSEIIAATVYWPLARFSKLISQLGLAVDLIPLSFYRDKSFYVMRTDAFDRFCTQLEKRFTRDQIKTMLIKAGFEDIRFSDKAPFWCALGFKKKI
jgi:ubiquinone/menaquinone biosynthesis C-methylase UbiE